MPITFADISSHNTVTNWPAFLGSVDACVVKAVQGSSYVWPGAPAALANIRAAGKLTGAYAFAGDLGSDNKVRCGNPVAEADYFLAHYDWRPGEVPVLDFEPSIMPAAPDGWCAAFLSRVASRIGVVPWTYMSTSVARSGTWAKTRATGSLLWAAQYGANNGQPGALLPVGAWGSCVAWQYTSMGVRPGVASPPLDLSFFYGDAAAWKAHGTPGADMPLNDADKAWIHGEIADQLRPIFDTLTPGITGVKYDGDIYAKVTAVAKAATQLLAQPPAQVDVKALAAAIVGALPAAQAQEVVNELGKRLNTPAA
jgi:GH25 family lysozyme M1 (1,4-beta-N-acetylmuramidase)